MSAFGGKADIKPTRRPHLAAQLRVHGPESQFFWKFVEGKAGSRESPGLFREKSVRLVVATEAAMR